MKKVLCIILCILMCCTVLPVLASCGNKTKEIDLGSCQIVRSSDLSSLAVRALNNLKKTITDKTGATVKLYDESAAEEGATTYEILVGNTTRKETEKALKSLKNTEGYTIQVIKNKVVIVGTNDALTYLALLEFEKNYLSTPQESTVISMQASSVKDDCVLFDLVKDGKIDYTVIYSRDWDTASNGSDSNLVENNKISSTLDIYDYQYRQILTFMSTFTEGVGIKMMNSQDDKRTEAANEILIGTTSRPETAEALSQIGIDQYIITTVNNKIVATAWNDQGVQQATLKLAEIMTDCIVKNGSEVTAVYPADLTYIGSYKTSWVTDFPKPTGENIMLYGTCDVSDNQVEYCYNGTGVTMSAFEAYIAQLQSQGYTIYSDNTVEGSRFTTLNNASADISLHVTYSAYSHDQANYEPLIRVISGKLSNVNLPQVTADLNYNKVFTDENVGADTGALICQIYLSFEESNVFGNSYVTMLEDGSFLLYDGGGTGKNNEPTGDTGLNLNGDPLVSTAEYLRLYDVMRDLQGLVGLKGSGITIAAWMMSHSHWDHMECFKQLCKQYSASIKLEAAYANFASTYEIYNSYNPGDTVTSLMTALSQTSGNGKYIKIHTGQTFWVRNAEIEVLYTHEDKFPEAIHYFNDTSTVYRIHYHVTDGHGNLNDGENGAVTGVWLGDLWKEGSALVSAMYGTYLKSDMVQVAHHGYNGCLQQIYSEIRPALVWWPVCGSNYVNQAYNTSSQSYERIADRYIANTLDSVKWILVAGAVKSGDLNGYNVAEMYGETTEGTSVYKQYRHNFTLRVTRNGIDGDKLYYACENYVGVGGDKFTGTCSAHGAGYGK